MQLQITPRSQSSISALKENGSMQGIIKPQLTTLMVHVKPILEISPLYLKDEPPVLLGKDQGANPVEYALAALNGCLTTTLIYHAAAQGIKIDEVESTLSGDLDIQGLLGMSEKVRNGYEKIKVTFKVKSDAPEEKIKELVDLAQKRSPVFDIISHPTPIEVSLQN